MSRKPKEGNPVPAVPGRLIPITEWGQLHPWPTPAALRAMIARGVPGHETWVVRVRSPRRVLIDEAAFWRWARSSSAA